eukprot:COSAG01_NODE_23158_length_826_cov_0.986245_1_plen_174_part_00
MDSHDVCRGRGEYAEVLNGIQQPVLVLGIRSDVLYPIHEQQELSNYLGNAQYHRRSVWQAKSLNWLRFTHDSTSSEPVRLFIAMSRPRFHVLESDEGHDGFLIEQEQVERHLRRFLRKVDKDALDERSISQAATLKHRESVRMYLSTNTRVIARHADENTPVPAVSSGAGAPE